MPFASWWGALRAARPAFLGYEAALALALPGATAALSLSGGMHPVVAAALAAADVALVLLRRRFPAAVLIVAAVLMVVPDRLDIVLAFGLAFAAGSRIGGSWRLVVTLGLALAAQLGAVAVRERAVSVPVLLLGAGSFLVVTVLPATFARLSAQRRRILSLMHERTRYLSEQQRIVAERARIREANRIAREMHDSLGHRLTLITLYAGALRPSHSPSPPSSLPSSSSPSSSSPPPSSSSPASPSASASGSSPSPSPLSAERIDETVRLLHATSVSAMDELRHILAVLRAEHAGGELDGDHDVERLVADARAAGASIELTRSGETADVPAMIEHAAFRTLQEGITNALRHARGGAIQAAVRFEEGALVVEVVNGPGQAQPGAVTGGQGLYGLAERVRLAGGVLYHGAEAGGGFRIAATLPLTSVAPQPNSFDASSIDTSSIDASSIGASTIGASTVGASTVGADSGGGLGVGRDDEFGADLRRADRGRRVWMAGVGVSLLLVGGLCVGGLWLAVRDQTVSAGAYEGFRVGEAADAVHRRLPDRDAQLDPHSVLPAPPPGGDCVAYRAAPSLKPDGVEGYRFCFAAGALVSKEELADVS